MNKENKRGIALINLVIMVVITILIIFVGIFFIFINKNKEKEENSTNNIQINEIEKNTTNEEQLNIVNENSETQIEVEKEKNYEIIDENQLLNWDTVVVKGKGLQDSGDYYVDELVNNFTANFNDKASNVMSKYPNSTYEDKVYFSKLDDSGIAASGLTNVMMRYDKDKDLITCFDIDVYTADEFYLNNIQLAGLKNSEIESLLGKPFADVTNDAGTTYHVYRFNGGYILIHVFMKTRYIKVVKSDYASIEPELYQLISQTPN